MITKEYIIEKWQKVSGKLDSVYAQLEDIWSWAMDKGYTGLADEVDRAQHAFGFKTSVSDVKTDIELLMDDMLDIVSENKKVSDLPKLLDLQMAFDQIQADVKRWEKIIYPNE